jgi:hypothetical protein
MRPGTAVSDSPSPYYLAWFLQDGSSACVDVKDDDLRELVRKADADAAELNTEEGMRRYFGLAPGEELPELALKLLDASGRDAEDQRPT